MHIVNWLAQAAAPAVDSVDAAEAKRRQDAGSLLIDVRELDEWRAGHAPNARHIPLGELVSRHKELPKDRELLVMCRSGNRSGKAQRLFQESGLTQVRNVTGGIIAGSRADLPIVP